MAGGIGRDLADLPAARHHGRAEQRQQEGRFVGEYLRQGAGGADQREAVQAVGASQPDAQG
jgi:hypothetical protein